MTGTASMDQSKLRREGHRSSPKLRAGKKRNVRALAAADSSAEAGLSALGTNSIQIFWLQFWLGNGLWLKILHTKTLLRKWFFMQFF